MKVKEHWVQVSTALLAFRCLTSLIFICIERERRPALEKAEVVILDLVAATDLKNVFDGSLLRKVLKGPTFRLSTTTDHEHT